MDFQFSGFEFREMMVAVEPIISKVQKHELETALIREFPVESERKRAFATVIALIKCYSEKLDIMRVKKVIVWRDRDGKPHDIQIEF